MTRLNVAARAGAWSAANRKKAIFGWLAFVIVAAAMTPPPAPRPARPVSSSGLNP